jgi:RNA polymerase sigma-70 factor (ECF subfamily)
VPDSSDKELEPQISAGLVERIGRGDRDAEGEMIRRYERGLLYLLTRRTRDRELALDLRQDTFRIVIEKLRAAPIDEPERLSAFLRGVALNLATADQRKSARRATTADSDEVESAADDCIGPFDHVSREQVAFVVRRLLAELRTPRDREILVRLYIRDEDKQAICESLGVDSTHFNRVLFRAKQRFRELLMRAEQNEGPQVVIGDSATARRGEA